MATELLVLKSWLKYTNICNIEDELYVLSCILYMHLIIFCTIRKIRYMWQDSLLTSTSLQVRGYRDPRMYTHSLILIIVTYVLTVCPSELTMLVMN